MIPYLACEKCRAPLPGVEQLVAQRETDAKVIAALREALETVKLFITDQTIAHAIVVPAHVDLNEWPLSNLEFPSLMQTIDGALAATDEQTTGESKCTGS